jgi:hypothetical protein
MENADKEFEYEKLKLEHEWRLTELRYRQQYQTRLWVVVLTTAALLGTIGLYLYRGTFEVPQAFIENIKQSEMRTEKIRNETKEVFFQLDGVITRSKQLAAEIDELRVRQRALENELAKLKQSSQ